MKTLLYQIRAVSKLTGISIDTLRGLLMKSCKH
jgi:hypothetical protein